MCMLYTLHLVRVQCVQNDLFRFVGYNACAKQAAMLALFRVHAFGPPSS